MLLQWLTLVLTSLATIEGNYVIYSPRITTWGSWGNFVYCPKGQYINGMQLKVEPIRKPGFFGYTDNTALNAIRFHCSPIGKPINHYNSTVLISQEGGYGSWGTILFCPEHTFVTGFQLRSERSKGANFISWIFGRNAYDDTAANNLNLFCSDKKVTLEGYGTSEGTWTSAQNCLERQAVCGFRTQVEPYKGKGDDSGLNNVDMVCCDIPNPAKNCTPQETWDVVKECDNTEGVTPLTCTYQKKIGLGHSDMATKGETDAYAKLGYDTATIGKSMMDNFGPLTKKTIEVKSEETVHTLSFVVPPGYKTELIQVVGTCGFYTVRTPKFIRSDTNMLNQTSLNEILDEIGIEDANTAE